jgi:hypothetical protein
MSGGMAGASMKRMAEEGVRRFEVLRAVGAVSWLAWLALLWLALPACAGAATHPPDLGDCSGLDGSCAAPGVSAGGGGPAVDGGVAAGGCAVSALGSLCAQCENAQCCTSLAACATDVDCENLSSCEESCLGSTTCIAACERHQSPKGIAGLAAFTMCVEAKCIVCSQSGVGDPCDQAASGCNPGLSCGGLGCTKPCARAADCAGLGAGGGNALNLPNACVEITGAGELCAPGCSVDADCTAFPGAFCFATTSVDGLAVRVCASTPDAGTD